MDSENKKPEKKVSIETPKSFLGDSRIGNLLKVEDSPSNALELLSVIFKLMVRAEEFEKLQKQLSNNTLSIRRNREIERNNELIRALTSRVPQKIQKKEKQPSFQFPKTKEGKPPAPPKGKEPGVPTPKGKTEPVAPPSKPTAPAPTAPKVPSPSVPPIIAGGAVVGGLLPLLAKGESNDYNQLVFPEKGSGKPSKAPLTEMTLEEVRTYQRNNMGSKNRYPSDAVGRYQIIGRTLESAITALQLDRGAKFDKTMQDKIYKEYLISKKRPDIENYISGKSNDIEAAQLALAKEFASFSVPERVWRPEARDKSGKIIWDARWIERGQSYYIAAANNKAKFSPEESALALQQEREGRLSNNKAAPVAPDTKVSDRVYKSSNENKQLNEQLNEQQNTNVVNNNVVNQNSSSGESGKNTSPDDRPIHIKKAKE
jgi:hypothetical protein